MNANTELWDKLGKTDPAHTKGFTRGGGFKGTAIKPMWSYRRMTEEFGPCGIGWGVNEPSFQVVPVGEEVLVYCTASIWYRTSATPTTEAKEAGAQVIYSDQHTVYGVGGDKVVAKFNSGAKSDDEAFKKAFTDAITNALKLIGVGADVHMGLFDDSKYVNSMNEEFGNDAPRQENKPVNASKNDDARNLYATLETAMRMATTKAELRVWWELETTVSARKRLPEDWRKTLHGEFTSLGASLPEGHPQKEAA